MKIKFLATPISEAPEVEGDGESERTEGRMLLEHKREARTESRTPNSRESAWPAVFHRSQHTGKKEILKKLSLVITST